MATIKQKYKSNEIIVNNKSSFKSLLVRAQSILDNTYYESLVLKGLGKATTRAVQLALQLNKNNYGTFTFDIKTNTVVVPDDKQKVPLVGANKDSFDPDEVVEEAKINYQLPAIEIKVLKNSLELSSMRKLRKLEKNIDHKK